MNLPYEGNEKLRELERRISQHEGLKTYWYCSNVNVIDRMGINDHGPVHIKIVANLALKILRLLRAGGLEPSVVKDHHLSPEEAEVIVVLAAALHDIGHIVHRENHEEFSITLAPRLIHELLGGLYEPGSRELAILTAETLHAIYAHKTEVEPLTVEAGVLKVADALDMEQGRARIPFQIGGITIHSVSAMAIDKVQVRRGKEKPIEIRVKMSNSAGIFQLDNLLKRKLEHSGIKDYFEINVEILEERKIVEQYRLS
ncbi:TPA: HD domain-containing protein [Candidatus Bipolaricaulota bacterium]|nr:HD domain-containing protein [Candidatus Bipolaricaulota bacterium]